MDNHQLNNQDLINHRQVDLISLQTLGVDYSTLNKLLSLLNLPLLFLAKLQVNSKLLVDLPNLNNKQPLYSVSHSPRQQVLNQLSLEELEQARLKISLNHYLIKHNLKLEYNNNQLLL